jgi:hypothetical protein
MESFSLLGIPLGNSFAYFSLGWVRHAHKPASSLAGRVGAAMLRREDVTHSIVSVLDKVCPNAFPSAGD